MFKREIKKQFNENKYNVLTAKGKPQPLKDYTMLRCHAALSAVNLRLPEAPRRHPGFDGARVQLHKEMVHVPPSPQGRVEAHDTPQRGTSSLRAPARGKQTTIILTLLI